MVKTTKAPNIDAFPAGIPQPALRALAGAGYMKLEDLAGVSKASLLALHGMGPKAIRLLEAELKEKGLEPLTS